MAAPLSVSHIDKAFGSHQVLQDIHFALKPGEIFGLIGLNGIGKTTLIKIILGLLTPDRGEVTVFGHPWTEKAAKRCLSYLPEKFQPSALLTGKECIELALRYYGKPWDAEQAERYAASLGLEPERLGQRVASYSKGMGQKVGLISTLMSDTALIILDEPMSGLDPMARIQLKRRLREAREAGRTIFFSSHILADIDEICDRIAILHDTRFCYYGTTQEFRATYPESSLERAFLQAIGEGEEPETAS